MTTLTHIFDTPNLLHQQIAALWITTSQSAIEQHGTFHVALSGGNTPKRLFQYLTEHVIDKIDWPQVHFYFADERHVPATHADSNYRLAKEHLFAHLPCPEQNIHRVPTELTDANRVSQSYSEILAQHLPVDSHNQPQFDCVLLGLGTDGHIASLFPNTAALHKTDTTVAANYIEKLQSWRITLTYPIINNAKQVMILVEGSQKTDIIRQVFNRSEADFTQYPIYHIEPHAGDLHWFIDKNAAQNISK